MRPVIFALLLTLTACASAPTAPPQPKAAPVDHLLDDVRILSADDMEGRAVDTPGSAKARAYIEQRFGEAGIDAIKGDDYEQPFIFTEKGAAHQGVNIVGRIEGTARSHAKHVLVVTAHYDHLGIVNGEIYNGADDNASGVAALLAIAADFAANPPRHDVIFAALDAEEGGNRGARVLVSDPPVPLSTMALNVNLDMLSRSDKNELYAAGASHFPFMKGRLEAIATRAPVSLKLGHDTPAWGEGQDWTVEGDHVAFNEKGIPWVYFGVEDHLDYHKPTDDFATIPVDFFRRSAATVLMAVRSFDDDLDAITKDSGR